MFVLQMSSEKVQNEIQAIDSILKALNTGGYDLSKIPQLSSGLGGPAPTAAPSVQVCLTTPTTCSCIMLYIFIACGTATLPMCSTQFYV